MTTATLSKKSAAELVGMAQIAVVKDPATAGAVLGSCIGLALYHARLRVGALAHIVLPEGLNRQGPPGKFADTAIPHMLELLMDEGANRAGLVAKLAGGSRMFGSSKGPLQIGDSNLAAVTRLLEALNIPIVGQHVGGMKGRRVKFSSVTGQLEVEVAGEQEAVL